MPCDAPVMTATFLSLFTFVSFILLSDKTLVPMPTSWAFLGAALGCGVDLDALREQRHGI
jgi:hypothetical protein